MLWLSFPCMLKLGEYEMWEIRIKQYFQIQDYALWEAIENGNSWNDVKARSLLLMALPNEHQLTFNQYVDAQSMFAAIKARFGGNEATKRTQKALLKQQYENFNASSSESLDSIFNRLQKLVSRLAILGVVTPPEDLNVKFLRSLPSEWDTHVVVWMNKPDFDTMGLDDLYNNFKIVEQKVKKSTGAINDEKNLAFLTTSGASSTTNINTVNPEVSTGTTKVNTASTETSTASFSDATVYAFLSTQPQGSQLVHEDLEQLHDDDLEEMDLKWNMALLSMRARKFYQRTGRKIIIDGSSTAGYDKSKVECFNCHKMGHFARECRAHRSIKDTEIGIKMVLALIGVTWQRKRFRQIMGLSWAFSDSEYDDLLVKLSDTDFKAATYKRGLATLEGQIVKYREHEVLFSEEIALLKRSVGCKEYELGLLRTELEKVKQEKEGFDFKIAKFDKSAKDLNEMLESFEEFKEPEVNKYCPRDSSFKPTTGCDKELDNSMENTDDSLEQHQMTDTETSSFESPLKVDRDWKEKFFYPANHVESVNQIEKQVRKNNDALIIEDWVSDDEDEVLSAEANLSSSISESIPLRIEKYRRLNSSDGGNIGDRVKIAGEVIGSGDEIAIGVLLVPVFLLGLLALAIDAACAFRAEEMPSLISCRMAAKVYARFTDVDLSFGRHSINKDNRELNNDITKKSTRKRQKIEEDSEKEELKEFLDIIPREEVPIEVESISTKFPIVDWKSYVYLIETFMYYQVFRGDGSSKNYKIFTEMLRDFDRHDVEELYRLVKERYRASRPEGYDLMLWGDLHTMFEPNEDDEL
ncbi:putative ribonuclease H-like domain-containing protein [Tanacetum coccineum]|uniref:Ribonuclease H-like domain-containing protein n=1 Tax=Tanacetum coccineum TaxID=301880 RepID=A0ABQ5ESL7_9ASTR